MKSIQKIFNRQVFKIRHDRIAQKYNEIDDFLHNYAAELLCERAAIFLKDSKKVLNLGARMGALTHLLEESNDNLIIYDTTISGVMAAASKGNKRKVVCDEEYLPFQKETFDAVVSCLNLHWVNDLPGTLSQIENVLKPGGVFIGSLLGGATLHELRHSISLAAAEGEIKMAPRMSPVVDTKTAGSLMQRVGLQEVVSDSFPLEVEYHTSYDLVKDLNKIGETNKLDQQVSNLMTRSELSAIIGSYDKTYRQKNEKVTATFEIITMTGWKKTIKNNIESCH